MGESKPQALLAAVDGLVYDELDQSQAHWPQRQPPPLHLLIVGVEALSLVSWHHPAVWGVPAGWRLAACFPDELIEAIAQEIHPWAIAVQWQPEFNFEEAQPFCLFQGKQHCSFCRAWLALKQCLRLPRDPVLLQKTWRLIPRDSWGELLLSSA